MSSGTPKGKLEFPKTLIEFGYNFDDNGELKKIDKSTGSVTKVPFEFQVQDDPDYNQKHYEALGDVSLGTTCIYQFL